MKPIQDPFSYDYKRCRARARAPACRHLSIYNPYLVGQGGLLEPRAKIFRLLVAERYRGRLVPRPRRPLLLLVGVIPEVDVLSLRCLDRSTRVRLEVRHHEVIDSVVHKQHLNARSRDDAKGRRRAPIVSQGDMTCLFPRDLPCHEESRRSKTREHSGKNHPARAHSKRLAKHQRRSQLHRRNGTVLPPQKFPGIFIHPSFRETGDRGHQSSH